MKCGLASWYGPGVLFYLWVAAHVTNLIADHTTASELLNEHLLLASWVLVVPSLVGVVPALSVPAAYDSPRQRPGLLFLHCALVAAASCIAHFVAFATLYATRIT